MRVVAVDLGATSGRVMTAVVGVDPDVLDLEEVHRFPNAGVRADDGSLRWDLERIHDEVLAGIAKAATTGPVDGIGIDSWAVDFGLLDASGDLLGAPYSHRDSRTAGVAPQVVAELGAERMYAENGLQQLAFNTVYQLVAARDAGELDDAETMLLIPDLLGHRLTGVAGAERTNASTTGLYGARTRAWLGDLAADAGLPVRLLPPLRDPGTATGTLLPEVAEALGLAETVPVIAVASHDTASAVVGVPAEGRFAYLSSGTWSLIGLELDQPVLSEAARAADFTNEAGLDGTVRLLTNVMGLWVLSQCQQEWDLSSAGGLSGLLERAAALPALRCVVDVDDPRLLPPADDGVAPMTHRLATLAAETGEPVPITPAEITRCVLDSLAVAYRRALRTAAEVSGRRPDVLHVVGGGSQNALLCRLTADACGLPVLAGPTEAAALGNVLVQARTLGVDLPDLTAMRALLRRTQTLVRYEPGAGGPGGTGGTDWAGAERRLWSDEAKG